MMENQYTLKIISYRMLQNYSTVHCLTCVSERKIILSSMIRSTLKIKKKSFYMSVEGWEFPPVGSVKYFKICEGYNVNFMAISRLMAISRQTSSHLCKICSFQPNSVPNITKKPEDSDQNLQIFEYILYKTCNSSTTGRHAKLTKRKFDFNILDIEVIIIH